MNNNLFQVAILTLMFCVAVSALPQESPIERLQVANATGQRLDVGLVDEVFDLSITESLSIEDALQYFAAIVDNEETPDLERVKSLLTIAHLHWQYGQPDDALEAIDRALEIQETTDGTLLKARLLDARGDEEGSVQWYEKAEASTDRSEEKEFIRIRLTMVQVRGEKVDSLVELANERDQEFRNRAAITLAVLGHPQKALELYRPDPESKFYFRQLIRVAEWALASEEHESAYEHAWLAYDQTEVRFDALYALSLVDEAYRKAQKLDVLVSDLEERGLNDEDLLNLRIDVLIDLEDFDGAIELFHAINQDSSDVEARQRLIQIYDTAGKSEEMVAEYEKLIASEPSIVQWYVGLSSFYINVAEPDNALEVWERFEQTNSDKIDVLVRGAEFMNQMGYVDAATGMIHSYGERAGPNVFGNVYLFETYLARGRDTRAEEALDELWGVLPPDSSDLRLVADGFERLGRYERALEVFLAIEEHEGKLGYDDRMRLAWLHSVVGNKEISLSMWQEIWVGESSPARRSFAEGQFLMIAAELNKLADIAVDIENRLFEKTADVNDINLLVRIYTEVGDSFSASEIVQEFAQYGAMDEVERLRQLGLVYLQLQEYSKYDDVLRQLEQIDPENRIEHIQNIVLNLLAFDLAEGGNERYADIQHWLAELREYDIEAVSGEFEASVLSMGGFTEEAIESYRRALIEQPTHSDNLLLMADLMKQSDRTDEAVALLQYVAEHAADDNEFVVAVDGIINMIGQRAFGQQLSTDRQATFRWTQRTILERITGREDKFYLYTLLSEIAQETNNREAEYIALENSVSQAGIRRLSVLREIVTMATPNAGFFTLNRNTGDPERQITFGRRLIGLRQQLPPSVYIGIAKTLLTQGDTIGAEKSLSLVRDITGQTDVNKTKADLFAAEGYTKQALAAYSQALSVNRDSLELQFKTAALREANGQFDVANALYLSGITKVLQGINSVLHVEANVRGRFNTSVSRDYRTYYEMLMQGLIATWPEDEELSQSKLDGLMVMLNEEVDNVALRKQELEQDAESSTEGEDEAVVEAIPYGRFSRLDHSVQMIRRLCSAIDRMDVVLEMDLALAGLFEDSQSLKNSLAWQYSQLGIPLPDELVAFLPTDDSPQQPEDESTRVELALQQAIQRRDVERVARMGTVHDTPKPLEQLFRDFMNAGQVRMSLRYAAATLDEADYQRLVNTFVPEVKNELNDLLRFITEDPIFALEVERQLGERMAEFDETFLRSAEANTFMNQYYNVTSLWFYARESGGIEEALRLFEKIVQNWKENQLSLVIELFYLHRDFMTTALSEELQVRVKDATSELMRRMDLSDEFVKRYMSTMVFNFDVHPDNVDVFLDILEDHEVATQSSGAERELLTDFYTGNRQRAFDTYLEMLLNDPSLVFYGGDAMFTEFKDEYLGEVEAIRLGIIDDVSHIVRFLNLSPRTMSGESYVLSPEQQIELYSDLAERYPEERVFLSRLLAEQLATNDRDGITKYLHALYGLDNSDEFLRFAYYLMAIESEEYDQALSVALDGGVDLRLEDVRDEIIARNDAEISSSPYTSSGILKLVRGVELYRGFSMVSQAIQPTMERFQESLASDSLDPDQLPLMLRGLWRNAQAANLDNSRSFYGSQNIQPMLLQWPSKGPPSPNIMYSFAMQTPSSTTSGGSLNERLSQYSEESIPTLMEVLITKAPVARELETMLISIDSRQRMQSTQLYDLVANAYQQYPEELKQRLEELSARITTDAANTHEFLLWLDLISRSGTSLSSAQAEVLLQRSKEVNAGMTRQLYTVAQLLADQGMYDNAIDCYERLVLDKVQLREFQGSRFTGLVNIGPSTGGFSLLELLDDATRRMPRDLAQQLVRRVVAMTRPFDSSNSFERLFEAFAIRAYSLVFEPDKVIEELKESFSDIDRRVDVVNELDSLRLAELARVEFRAENFDRANAILRSMFSQESIVASAQVPSPNMVISSRMAVNTSYTARNNALNMGTRLGIQVPGISNDMVALRADYDFPTSAYVFNSLLEYVIDLANPRQVDAVAQEMVVWLDDSKIDRPSVVESLANIAYLLHQNNEEERAIEVLNDVQEWLANQPNEIYSQQLVQPLALISPVVGFAVDIPLAKSMIELNLLDRKQEQELLQLLRAVHPASEMLEVAQIVDSEFAGLGLLREIRAIAEEAGDEIYASELNARIETLESAFEAIQISGELTTTIEST